MHVELNYGKGKLPVELRDDWDVRVIGKKAMPVVADPAAAVREALAEPVGAPPLAEAAKPGDPICRLDHRCQGLCLVCRRAAGCR